MTEKIRPTSFSLTTHKQAIAAIFYIFQPTQLLLGTYNSKISNLEGVCLTIVCNAPSALELFHVSKITKQLTDLLYYVYI
ncbi:hypothetical protein QUB80_02780 [Chlorogloeopsis sp. ULAP01]|uniref:hypothetical protein n=1 Tax=Chlorogloeopsis sp. ULAP01 TaxID=3056483 RepID=UPI0025AACC9B|nr:hypothetical protein [Chlorogloeopsis sp. ULAP01]MDM9379627.1 hypothetical protein [Chlorogloeopsis sp. ULAP01]